MRGNQFSIVLLEDSKNAPMDLLLLADPSLEKINEYINESICFIGKLQENIIGVLALYPIDNRTAEIKNIAVSLKYNGMGYGSALLTHAIEFAKVKNLKQIVIATGNSSHRALEIYQKAGFVITHIEKDFFVKGYEAPIFENGIQCVDKIFLSKDLI